MLASLSLPLARSTVDSHVEPLAPLAPELICVSTSVTLKAQWCEKACKQNRLPCPAACLCTDLLFATERHTRASRGVLIKLAAQLQNTSAAERPAAMQAARRTAGRVVHRLTTKLKRADKDGPTCTRESTSKVTFVLPPIHTTSREQGSRIPGSRMPQGLHTPERESTFSFLL